MSAALQLPMVWGAAQARASTWHTNAKSDGARASAAPKTAPAASEPEISLAFYRRHTGSLLRRYLYASMQVGRAPAVLSDPVGRGWASSRPVRSFEDALIFVLDVERCLNRLEPMDRQLVSRIVLQEYTQMETAAMLGMCVRTVSSRLARAMDRLTEQLLATGLLVIPD